MTRTRYATQFHSSYMRHEVTGPGLRKGLRPMFISGDAAETWAARLNMMPAGTRVTLNDGTAKVLAVLPDGFLAVQPDAGGTLRVSPLQVVAF